MEVDHRAKNVLAVVDSIVRLSKADDPARYAAAVQQRVQALSVAHSLLSELGWQDVPLREVVQRQIAGYKIDDIELNGPYIPVPAVIVQPLALVFHELVSNAAIHGAFSKPGGRLSLSWETTRGIGGFRMMWREFGTTPPATDPQAGFGTVMVKAVVEKQLSGNVTRQWDKSGLAITIEVPGAV
jgi:two-component sensor histidine kinase